MFIGVGVGVSVQSLVSPKPVGGSPPINTVAPEASGTFTADSTVSCTTGTWSSDAGSITYAYQWEKNGSPISGATSSAYVLTPSDVLAIDFICVVTATNDAGSASADSNNIAVEPP
jgi:hypothetical protein